MSAGFFELATKPVLHCVVHDAERRGLGKVIVHSCLEAARSNRWRFACRKRNDGRAHAARAQFAGGLKAVHLRHLAVHEDQVERRFCAGLKRLAAVHSRPYVHIAKLFQHGHGDDLVHLVVLDEQNRRIARIVPHHIRLPQGL